MPALGLVRRMPWPPAAGVVLGALALAVSALDLSAHGLARYLTSDFLTPFFFCGDLLDGRYPISGWTLSASPYFVPDHAILSTLLAAFGRDGLGYALYTPVFFVALAVVIGGCIRTVTGRVGSAMVAAFILGNILLAARFLPGHAQRLWWLGAPTCHGGVLLLGLAYWWTLAEALRADVVDRLRGAVLFSLCFVGLLSDSLFLFQAFLPATAALFVLRRRHPACRRSLGPQLGTGVAGLALAQLFKPICQIEGWFYFSRILRVAPTPANQWHTLRQFLSDVPILVRENWFFAVIAVAAAAWLLLRRWSDPPWGNTGSAGHDFLRIAVAMSLVVMLPLPIATCAWKDESNVRYLLNWLVLPGFLLTLEMATRFQASRWLGATAAVLFSLCLGTASNSLAGESLRFPHPDDVAALDAIVRRHGLKYGVAQYWDAKLVTALSHAGVEVRQVRANGAPFFWDNNVFAYYDASHSWPAYRFVLVDRLDEADITQAYGEPVTKESAGAYRVWIYGDEGQARIRATVEPAVQDKIARRSTR